MKKAILGGALLLGFALILLRAADPVPPEGEVPDFGVICEPKSGAVMMVLNHYGKKLDDECRLKMSPDEMAKALRRRGVPVTLRSGTLPDLKRMISLKRPAILLVRSGKQTWHYVVAIAYGRGNFVYADPATGEKVTISEDGLIHAWDFSRDIRGRDVRVPCPGCQRRGKSLVIPWTCLVCSGRKTIDPLRFWLRTIEIYPRTMIVPDHPHQY